MAGMYGASPLNRAALAGATVVSQPPPVSMADQEWTVFEEKLTEQRRKLNLVRDAMRLYDAADAALVNVRGTKNTNELEAELANLRSTLEHLRIPGNEPLALFSVDALEKHVSAAMAALDSVLNQAKTVRQDAPRIKELTGAIKTDQQEHFGIESLYGAAERVRSVLSSSFESQLAMIHRFESRYSRTRERDELVSTHSVTIDISSLKSSRIDLSDLIAGVNDDPTKAKFSRVQIEVDGVTRPDLTPSSQQQPLGANAKKLRIVRTFAKSNVARPARHWAFPSPVFEVDMTWPLASSYAITLSVPAYGTSGAAWPYEVRIEAPENATLDRIAVPKHSFFYSAPPMEMTAAPDSDELAAPKNLTLREMENDTPIRVQVLATWLSLGIVQSYKDRLFFDNLIAAVVVALLAALPSIKLF